MSKRAVGDRVSTGLLILLLASMMACRVPGMNWLGAGPQPKTASKVTPSILEEIRKASEVDDAAVGYAGIRTRAYDAFSRLYQEGNAASETAKQLMESASPAGKIYGYLVLRHISRAEADAAAQKLQDDSTEVIVMTGCIMNHATVSELVAKIRGDKRVIKLPD